jgi:hypothetical protein
MSQQDVKWNAERKLSVSDSQASSKQLRRCEGATAMSNLADTCLSAFERQAGKADPGFPAATGPNQR